MALYNREAILCGNHTGLPMTQLNSIKKIRDRNYMLCNARGGVGAGGGGPSASYVLETTQQSINEIHDKLISPSINIDDLTSVGNELTLLKEKLNELSVSSQAHINSKTELLEKIDSLIAYRKELVKEINKLLAANTPLKKISINQDAEYLSKSDPVKTIAKDVLLGTLMKYLNLTDMSRASQVSKEWKSICYDQKLPYKVMLLNKAKTTVVRLPVPTPTLGEYNKARRLADNSSILPFWTSGKIKKLHQQLDEINIQKLSLRK